MPAILESALTKRMFTPTQHPDIMVDQYGQQCVDIGKVVIPPNRVREDFKDLNILRDTILEVGLIQPIKLQSKDGKFVLAAGGRRLRAFLMTGQRYIPFSYDTEDDVWAKKVELYENQIREGVEWPEYSKGMTQLHNLMTDKYGADWNQHKTASIAGVSQKTVSTNLKMGQRLLKNPKLAETLRHLPMHAALKSIKRTADVKQAEENIASGALVVQAAVKHMSCLDGISTLENGSISLLLTDPPFGDPQIEMDKTKKSNIIYTGTLQPEDNLDFASYRVLTKKWIPLAAQKMIVGAHFYIFFSFAHYQFLFDTLKENGFIPEEDPLIWYKNRTSTSASGYNYPRSYEPIMWGHFQEKKRHLCGDNLRDLIECPVISPNERLHNFQKPDKLLLQLISNSTIIGETVLDPFAGSGAICKQALKLQRNAIGFEINQHNYLSSQLNLKTT